MIMTKILMTIPPAYQHFVTAWKSASHDQRTLTNLSSRLVIEETRVNAQQGNSALSANNFPKHFKRGKRKGGKNPGTCYKCGETGHWQSQCEKSGETNKEKKSEKGKKEKEESKKGNKPKVLIVSVGVTTAAEGQTQEDKWYLD